MKRFLTIAGSDCSGGAGIQADMRAAVRHGLFPMSVITALTAQTGLGVRNILLTPPKFVAEQLNAVFYDFTPDIIKIGMLGNHEIVELVAQKLSKYDKKGIVLDTVFSSSSGYELLNKDGVELMKRRLLSLCNIITPNIPEAELLTDMKITNRADMENCAIRLSNTFHTDVIITGGHLDNTCDDLLFYNGKLVWFYGEKIKGKNTHGTGCAFSSCLACNLALGEDLEKSVKKAKEYVAEQIKRA